MNPKDTLRPIASHARPRSGPGRFPRSHRGNTVSYLNQTHAVRTTRDMPDLEGSQRVQGGRKADAVRACTTRPRKMGLRHWLRI
jgi:hypothetical protein